MVPKGLSIIYIYIAFFPRELAHRHATLFARNTMVSQSATAYWRTPFQINAVLSARCFFKGHALHFLAETSPSFKGIVVHINGFPFATKTYLNNTILFHTDSCVSCRLPSQRNARPFGKGYCVYIFIHIYIYICICTYLYYHIVIFGSWTWYYIFQNKS